MDGKQDRTTSGVECHHRLWAAHTIERRRAWHAIIAFGKHTRSNDIGRGMPLSPLGSTHGRTMSGVACHHIPWTTNTVEQRWAWHAITALGQHTRSDDIGRGMPSSPFGSTNGHTTSTVVCHLLPWTAHTVERRRAWHDITSFGQRTWSNDVEHDMTSPPLESTHGRMTSGVACHHRLWEAHTVERHRAWHAIIAYCHGIFDSDNVP